VKVPVKNVLDRAIAEARKWVSNDAAHTLGMYLKRIKVLLEQDESVPFDDNHKPKDGEHVLCFLEGHWYEAEYHELGDNFWPKMKPTFWRPLLESPINIINEDFRRSFVNLRACEGKEKRIDVFGKMVEGLFSWMLERHLSLEQASLDQLQAGIVKKSDVTWQGWKHE